MHLLSYLECCLDFNSASAWALPSSMMLPPSLSTSVHHSYFEMRLTHPTTQFGQKLQVRGMGEPGNIHEERGPGVK